MIFLKHWIKTQFFVLTFYIRWTTFDLQFWDEETLNKQKWFNKLEKGELFYTWIFYSMFIFFIFMKTFKMCKKDRQQNKTITGWFNGPWRDWRSDYPNLSEPIQIFHRLVSLMTVVSSPNLCPRSKEPVL